MKYLLITLLLFLTTQTILAHTWKISSLNWAPYSSSNIDDHGNSIRKLQKLLRLDEIELKVDFLPWSRAKSMARQGRYIGYFPSWVEGIKEDFEASPAIDYSMLGIFKKKGQKVEFSSIDELFRKYKVGVIKSYTYPLEIQAAIKKYPKQVDYAQNEKLLVLKLSSGRHHTAISTNKVLSHITKRMQIENIVKVKNVMLKKLSIAFTKNKYSRGRVNLIKRLLKIEYHPIALEL